MITNFGFTLGVGYSCLCVYTYKRCHMEGFRKGYNSNIKLLTIHDMYITSALYTRRCVYNQLGTGLWMNTR